MSGPREVPHYINGQRVAGTSGRHGDVFDPNTGAVQARVGLASTAELGQAVAAAKAAQPAWPPPIRKSARGSCSVSRN